jgi:hypothetical protein
MTREVKLEQLQSYDGMLNAVAAEAESEFRAAMAAKAEALGAFEEWDGAVKSEFRDFAAEQMRTLGLAFGDASASTAQTFCDTALDSELDVALSEDGCITSESAEKSARYWAGSLYGDDASAQRFVDGCAAKVNRSVSHAADLRVAAAAVSANKGGNARGGRKRVKFARVPVGPTCPFCIMLASRGFVYATAKTAGELGQYHDRCNCRIIAGYEGLQVEGYNYEDMYKRFGMCMKTLGGEDQVWKDWEGLSADERGGMKFSEYSTKRILHEMDTRDRRWLFDGTIPEPTFESKALETEIRTKRPHEIRTAWRLAQQGVRIDFWTDFTEERDAKTGAVYLRGLPDSRNGYEIKTLNKSVTINTVNDYLRNASRKRGCSALVFDISEVQEAFDIDALIRESRRFKKGRVYVLNGGSYRLAQRSERLTHHQ